MRAIIALAHNLHIDVIAEGVETAEERALLVDMGMATKGQGSHFSAPVDAAHAFDLLQAGLIKPDTGPRQVVQGTASMPAAVV
jgi:EAL domain-containing protein (putative c-di-GMP-specific phosphodiesterase class I)